MPQTSVLRGSVFQSWGRHCLWLTVCVIGSAQSQGNIPTQANDRYAATRALPLEIVGPNVQLGRTHENVYPGDITSGVTSLHWNELARLQSLARGESKLNPSQKFSAKIKPMTSAEAAWILGLLSLHGIAMPIDTDLAKKWFKQAIDQGFFLAHAGLAWCAIEECLAPHDPVAAEVSIEQLRKINASRALYLEWLTLTHRTQSLQDRGRKETMTSEPDSGFVSKPLPYKALLLEAARQGDVQARIELGIDSAARMQFNESLAYFNSAAKESNVAAGNAKIMMDRLKQTADLNAPVKNHPLASNANSLLKQARKQHKGEGVPANYTEALRLYSMAASAGSLEAEKMLRLIYARVTADGQIDLAWMQQLQDIDLTSSVPSSSKPTPPFWLRREPTALYDLLPPMWRLLK